MNQNCVGFPKMNNFNYYLQNYGLRIMLGMILKFYGLKIKKLLLMNKL